MTVKDIKDLLRANFVETPQVNFSDANDAALNALVEHFKLEDLSPREIKVHKNLIMALIEEVIDEILPQKLEDRVKEFAEIKQFARDAEVVFEIRGVGKRRAYMTIKKGQRGGLYQAARLDDIQMSIPTWVETVGVFVTLEEILLGKYSLRELMDNILDGFVERLYVEVIEALQSLTSPDANHGAAPGVDPETLDGVIRIVAAYGSPIIMGFHNTVTKISNNLVIPGSNPTLPASDLDEIKQNGFIGTYKSIPVIKLPNYIVNENTNEDWLLDESKMFILPAGAKPVKVALKGDLHIEEVKHPSGSFEWNAHKILGVGLLLANNIGTYSDTGEESED